MRKRENWLPALILLIVYFPAAIMADGWVATDSASQYGFPASQYPGEDSPPPPSYQFSVAPDPVRHDMFFYDYANNGQAGQPSTDIVQDRRMRWSAEQIQTFNNHYDWNYVHQVIVDDDLFEADSYISTNLPNVTHNEDDPAWEEWDQGYEEKEVGTLFPEFLDRNTDYYVSTHWIQLTNGSGQFTSQAELTEDCGAFCDDWYPRGQRDLGRMRFLVNNNAPSSVIWDFDTANNFEGWVPFKTSGAAVNNGILFIDPAGNDPYVEGPGIQASASYYKYVLLDMASNAEDGGGRIYFKTQSSNFYSDDKSVPFTVHHCPPSSCNGGAQFRDYSVNMTANSKWAGTITGIRVDPANNGRAGTNIDTVGFDSIRLSRHSYSDSGEPDFSLVAEQQSQTVTQGGVAQFRIRADFAYGSSGPVQDFVIMNPPPGASVSFSPATVNSSGGSTTLSVATSNSTPTGTSSLLISAGNNNQYRALVNVELTVNPLAEQAVNIIPNVRLNGQSWSGLIGMRITGPQGVVVDRAVNVPAETFAVPPGFYTIQYTSGGPSSASLSQVWAAQPCGATGTTGVSCNYTSASLNNGVFFDFSGSPLTYSIGGRVTDSSGAGISDLQVSVSGAETWYTRTTSTGNYSFFNLPSGGRYTVAPSGSNYTFNPQAVTFNSLTADSTANFTGTLRPSPAGKIAFTRGFNESAEIWVINADGTGLTQLTHNSANDEYPTWSPDGTKIAFVSWRDGNKEIYVMNSDGSNQRNLTNHYEYDHDPAWSPDGSKIAFHSYRDGNAEIYVMNADGGSPTRLTNNAQTIDSEATWSPDGTKIAFQRFQNFVVDIYSVNVNGTDLRNLTNNPGQSHDPAWSPGGDKIAFSRDGEIFVMNPDGTGQTNITRNPAGDSDPSWSPDGSALTFISYREDQQDLYVMSADGSNQTRLTYTADDDYDPSWQQRAGPTLLSVTVGTSPAGLLYMVDGVTYTTTQTFSWVPNSNHTVSAPATQNPLGLSTRFAWTNWSDNGVAEHTISPLNSTTYTAFYSTQYYVQMNSASGGNVAPGSGWYNSGHSLSISAAPSSGYGFGGWTGSGSGSYTGLNNPAAVVVNGPITETASFTATPPSPCDAANPALACNGATAVASSTFGSSNTAAAAINGDRKGIHWGSDPATGSGWHDATNNAFPDSLEVIFSGAQTISEVTVFSVQDGYTTPADPTEQMSFSLYGLQDFDVEYWTGSAWQLMPNGSVVANNKVQRKVSFTPLTTSKIRVVVKRALAGYSRLVEVEARAAETPTRANYALTSNGATAVSSSTLDSTRTALAATNGDRKGIHWGSDPSTGSGWHDATNNSYPDWLEITFPDARSVSEVYVFSVQDNVTSPSEPTEQMTFTQYGVTSFDVEYWTGSAWAVVPGGMVVSNNKVWAKVTFAPVTTQKIRVVVKGALAGYSRIAEIEVWGPVPATTPPPRVNVAAAANGATAAASSTFDAGRAASAAINGDRRAVHWGSDPSTGSGWHDATNNSYPDWLEVTFNGSKSISEVHVFSVQDNVTSPSEPTEQMTFTQYGVTSFDVEYWTGSAWAVVPGGMVTSSNKVWAKVTFAPLQTTKIRVVVKGALAGYSRIAEIEAYLDRL